MVLVRLILLISLAFVSNLEASWHEPFCQAPPDSNQVSCTPVSSQSITSPVPSHVFEFGAIDQGATSLLEQIEFKVDEWGDFTRWLNGLTLKGSADGFDERWNEYEQQARALIEVEQALASNKQKRDVCYRGMCGAGQRVDLEVQQQQLEKVKAGLFSIAPWWLSEDFIEISKSGGEISSDSLKTVLGHSMANFFKETFELKGQISAIKASIDDAMVTGKHPSILMSELVLRNRAGLEAISKRAVMLSEAQDRQFLCRFLDRKQNVENTISGLETTFEIGLMASSLLLGPESILMMGGVRSVASRGLFAELRTLLTGTSRMTAYMADAAYSAKLINDSFQKADECREVLASIQIEVATVTDWESCLKQRSRAALTATLGTVLSAGSVALPLVRALIPERVSPVVFKHLENDGVMSILDLSRKSEIDSRSVAQLSDNYWDFVADTYRTRLNLSADEITGFIQSSRAFEPRTKLVVMTRGPPRANQIEGGVAMVESSRAADLMPFEKATGVKVPRDQGKVAEIVRLTAASDTNPNLMKDLLNEMAQVVKADPSVKKLYVYTSKVHARLYKRLGLTPRQIGEPIDRDVILEIDAADFVTTLMTH
tara:strand:- start:7540 stop:9342 length:1803 start_codon:yes stop_codon:yes gene_type:complete